MTSPVAPPTVGDELVRLVEEAKELMAGNSFCHRLTNDVEAIVLVQKMQVAGFQVDVRDARRCIERIRVCIETGSYPDHLLEAQDRTT